MTPLESVLRSPRAVRVSFKRMLPRGLFGRSLLIIVIPLVLLQIVSGVIFYDRHWANVSRHRADALAGEISMVVDLLHRPANAGSPAELFDLARRALDLILEYREGAILPNAHFVPSGNLERTLARAMSQIVHRPFVIETGAVPNRVVIDVQLPGGVLHVQANEERLISSTTKVFILWMVGASLVLFAVATLFMRNQVSPIRRLAAAADNFGKGRDTPHFRPSGATEVRQAAAAFMAMRDRIQRQIQQRTEMLAGVSHDLRTPLTRMKLEIAMMAPGPEIEELRSDVAQMEGMIEGYLNFARGEGSEPHRRVDAAELLDEVRHEAERNGIAAALHTPGPVELPLARNAFKRCIANLVDNAARHGKRVEVALRRNGSVVEITVDDDGPGIPEAMREEVFRPFFRLDQSRNAETGGTGLGLAIARDIVHGHGGEISLSDSPLGGLRVLIRVPT